MGNSGTVKRVLIIEDDPNIREIYREVIEGEGFEVEVAEDGLKGFNMIKNGGYSVILLDLLLPGMNGLEILKTLKDPSTLRQAQGKTDPGRGNGPILVLTNLAGDQMVAEAVSSGAAGYFIKADNTPDKLVEEIRKLVGEEE